MFTDQQDYALFLREVGLDEQAVVQAGKTVKFTADTDDSLALGPSKINGSGVFAIKPADVGKEIPLMVGGVWTRWGRFLNHSWHPSLEVSGTDKDLSGKLTIRLKVGEELTVDYRHVKK